VLNRIKSRAYGVISSKTGDRFAPIRLAKQAARAVNDAAGRPLASEDELAERIAYESRGPSVDGAGEREQRDAAPVIIFHTDKHHQKVKKMRGVLDAAGVPYRVENIDGDLPAIEATERDANGFALPVCFIGGDCVGSLNQLIDLNNNGKLRPLVFGD
jgi:hypothetical protein